MLSAFVLLFFSMKKLVRLPVPVFIFKFLQHPDIEHILDKNFSFKHSSRYGRILLISQRVLMLDTSKNDRSKKYLFSDGDDKMDLTIEIDSPTERRLYSVALHLQDIFRKEMRRAMINGLDYHGNAMKGLRDFFDLCEICEEDYKVATAYKDFQRYKKKLDQKKERKWTFKNKMAVISAQ